MKQLVIYDSQGRELSRMNLPKFINDSDVYRWAQRVFKARREVDKRYDHFDIVVKP